MCCDQYQGIQLVHLSHYAIIASRFKSRVSAVSFRLSERLKKQNAYGYVRENDQNIILNLLSQCRRHVGYNTALLLYVSLSYLARKQSACLRVAYSNGTMLGKCAPSLSCMQVD